MAINFNRTLRFLSSHAVPSVCFSTYYIGKSYLWLNRSLWGAELNPYRVIWVDPKSISIKFSPLIAKNHRNYCHVIDGDWDLKIKSFNGHWLYKMLHQRFVENKPWTDIQEFKDVLEGRINWSQNKSVDNIWRRAKYLDLLFNSMQENGYLSPANCLVGKPGLAKEIRPSQIKIRVDREGKFSLETGRHRLALALILDFKYIPVQPIIRHTQWQQKRIQIREKGLSNCSTEELHHPDLNYLLYD